MNIPRVHINGTSAGELIEQRLKARTAILLAMGELQETRPHMRDFYLVRTGTEEYNAALATYHNRFQQLSSVWTALEEDIEAIQAQVARK